MLGTETALNNPQIRASSRLNERDKAANDSLLTSSILPKSAMKSSSKRAQQVTPTIKNWKHFIKLSKMRTSYMNSDYQKKKHQEYIDRKAA